MPWYNDPKHPLKSKTIWAGIAQIAVAGLVATTGVELDTAHLSELLFSAFNLASGAFTIYGRFTANRSVNA